MKRDVYFSFHIAIDEIPWNLEPLSEDVQLPITPDETNEHNASVGYVIKPWKLDSRRKRLRDIIESSDGL